MKPNCEFSISWARLYARHYIIFVIFLDEILSRRGSAVLDLCMHRLVLPWLVIAFCFVLFWSFVFLSILLLYLPSFLPYLTHMHGWHQLWCHRKSYAQTVSWLSTATELKSLGAFYQNKEKNVQCNNCKAELWWQHTGIWKRHIVSDSTADEDGQSSR